MDLSSKPGSLSSKSLSLSPKQRIYHLKKEVFLLNLGVYYLNHGFYRCFSTFHENFMSKKMLTRTCSKKEKKNIFFLSLFNNTFFLSPPLVFETEFYRLIHPILTLFFLPNCIVPFPLLYKLCLLCFLGSFFKIKIEFCGRQILKF